MTLLIGIISPAISVMAEEVPTNKELYEMLLKTQNKVEMLEQRALKAEAEAEEAKKELARVKGELEKPRAVVAEPADVMISGSGGFERADKTSDNFYVKAQVSLVAPVFERLAVVSDTDFGAADGTRIYEMEHDLTAAPKLTLGYKMNNGLGFEASAFYLNSHDNFSLTEGAGASLNSDFDTDNDDLDMIVDGTFVADDELTVWVADFDVYKTFGNSHTSFTIGGGLRYANINRSFFAFETGGNEFIEAEHEIEGFGPRLRLGGKFPVYKSISFYADGAASLIYADEDQKYQGDGGGGDLNEFDDSDKLLPILEAELGIEWRPESFSKQLALRAGVEGQTWLGGGGWEFVIDDGGADFADEFSWSAIGFNFSAAYEF